MEVDQIRRPSMTLRKIRRLRLDQRLRARCMLKDLLLLYIVLVIIS
jgi:hypothetical protein